MWAPLYLVEQVFSDTRQVPLAGKEKRQSQSNSSSEGRGPSEDTEGCWERQAAFLFSETLLCSLLPPGAERPQVRGLSGLQEPRQT